MTVSWATFVSIIAVFSHAIRMKIALQVNHVEITHAQILVSQILVVRTPFAQYQIIELNALA